MRSIWSNFLTRSNRNASFFSIKQRNNLMTIRTISNNNNISNDLIFNSKNKNKNNYSSLLFSTTQNNLTRMNSNSNQNFSITDKRFIWNWLFGSSTKKETTNQTKEKEEKENEMNEKETEEEKEIREIAQNGHPVAQFQYSRLLALKNDLESSLHWLKLSAESRSYPLSILTLAESYLEGHFGLKKDNEMATYWYRIGAEEMNDPICMVTLSRLLIVKLEDDIHGKKSEESAMCMLKYILFYYL